VTTAAVTTTSWASGRASAGANTTAVPFVRFCLPRRAAGWYTACRPAPVRERPPAWATTARWPPPPRGGPRACPSPVGPVSSCTCGSGTRFSPETTQDGAHVSRLKWYSGNARVQTRPATSSWGREASGRFGPVRAGSGQFGLVRVGSGTILSVLQIFLFSVWYRYLDFVG